jgi:hypothetical protein
VISLLIRENTGNYFKISPEILAQNYPNALETKVFIAGGIRDPGDRNRE